MPGRGKGLRKGARVATVTAEALVVLACVGVLAVVLRPGHGHSGAPTLASHSVPRSQAAEPVPAYTVGVTPPHPVKAPVFPGAMPKSEKTGKSDGRAVPGPSPAPARRAPGAAPSTGDRPVSSAPTASQPSVPVGSSASASTKHTVQQPSSAPASFQPSSAPAQAPAQVEVSGQVNCTSNAPITGFWVQTENGTGSGWASWRVATGANADYWFFMPADESYKLSVGCGGTAQHWAVTTYGGSVTGTHNSFVCDDEANTAGSGKCEPRS